MGPSDDTELNPLLPTLPDWVVPVAVLALLLALAYLGMWLGWRRRARKHDVPPLVPSPTVGGDWLDRVVAQGLGARSLVRLRLSAEGLDVVRVGGSFRIPAEALRGARHDQGIAGKVVPPHGVLVVTWQHGSLLLDSGFRLEPPRPSKGGAFETKNTVQDQPRVTDLHNRWIRSISKLARDNEEHKA